MINYDAPTYHNGQYVYPGWAHGLGWAITATSLVCIPAFAIYQIARAEGDTLGQVRSPPPSDRSISQLKFPPKQKIMNTLKPNLYECKICGEHHCDHDFPDEDFPNHEMALVDSTSGAPLILQAPPPGRPYYNYQQQQYVGGNAERNGQANSPSTAGGDDQQEDRR